MTQALISIINKDSDLLGGMWAAVATVFVFRTSREDSWSAGAARLIATSVSFALCLLYLWFFPFTVTGMTVLIGIGTLAMMLLDRREDIVTTGITTVVVMVVAAISPLDASHQPLLRLIDTVVGVGVGVACKWAASLLYFRGGTSAMTPTLDRARSDSRHTPLLGRQPIPPARSFSMAVTP